MSILLKLAPKCAAVVLFAAAGASAQASNIFGLNDTGGIYAINPANGSASLYRSTIANPNGQLNALSYNPLADTFYYVTQGNRQLVAASPVANTIIATLPTGSYADATFWNDSIWSIRDNSGKLVRIDLSGVSPIVKEYSISGIGTPSFGDIAINSNGTLFGAANNNFFSINLNTIAPSSTTVTGSTLSTAMVNLQLGLVDGTLYGIETDTDKVYSINTSSGARTLVSTLNPTSLKINDAAAYIPEASSALPLLGIGSLFILRRRRA